MDEARRFGQSYYLVVHFNAAPARVFDAWIIPSLMKQWLFVGPQSQIESIEIDLQVSGRFSILENNSGELTDHFGCYRELSRPKLLGFELEAPKHFNGRTFVRVRFFSSGSGCEMLFEQFGVQKAQVESSWQAMFTNLQSILKSNEL